MKKYLYLCLAVGFLACQSPETKTDKPVSEQTEKAAVNFYGEKISEENAVPAQEVKKLLANADSAQVKIVGKIDECCQKKGCWLKVDIGNGEMMTVKFKDYGFFVPLESAGKEIVFEGVAKRETTDVATLKHYAQDAGKSAEEIAKITEAKQEITFEASGVLIKEK